MKKTTYLVDDAPDCLVATEAILRQNGTQCVGMANWVTKALRQIPRLKPDLVFLDLVLPGITGFECARQLKLKMPELKIFMLTDVAGVHAAYAAKLAGVSAYLLKPLLADEFHAALANSALNLHPGTGNQKSCSPLSPSHNHQPETWDYFISPRLACPRDTAETYDEHEFPVRLTNRLFALWSGHEAVTAFWSEFAQKNHFCVKLLAAEMGTSPQELSREWRSCFHISPKESFNHFRRIFISRAIAEGRTKLEDWAKLCGYSKISHIFENHALNELLARRHSFIF